MEGDNMLRLLIVEDTKEQIKVYEDTIDEFNAGSEIKINIEIGNNLKEGLKLIRTKDFDAAIIDLILGSDDIEGKGKQIIKEIKSNLRFPVFVFTAFPGNLDEDLKKENVFYRVYEQTKKDTTEVLKEMADIYKTGITKIIGSKGIIEETLQKVFWENIAKNMEYWKKEVENKGKIEKILSRHILAHLVESLRLTEEGKFEKCHPAEVYIMPPVKKYFFTGDILKNKDSGEYFLILTSACDMELRQKRDGENWVSYRNADKIILAKLTKFNQVPEVKAYIENQSNGKKKEVKKYVNNTKKERYYYLPSFGTQISGFLIDFQNINQINQKELTSYDRVASIDEPFLKDIIVRFTSYYARQGSPDLDTDIILKRLIND